jgi:hypothetical protein
VKPAIDSAEIGALIAAADSQKGDARQVIPRLLAAIRQHLGMDVAFVAEFAAGERVFRHVDAAVEGAPRRGDRDSLAGSYCHLVAEGRIPELITDAGRVVPESARVRGRLVGAQICVPMVAADGSTYGTFCCFSREPDPSLSERDLAITGVFAGLALQTLERSRAAERSQAEIRKRITHVLKLDKVHAVYQPMVKLGDKTIAGFECLSRFDAEPKQGPDFWFAEAASVGMGPELELGVVRRALPALDKLPARTHLSFNVSPQLLLDGRLERELASGANGARIAGRLVLEITEHETVKEYERLASVVRSAIDAASSTAAPSDTGLPKK